MRATGVPPLALDFWEPNKFEALTAKSFKKYVVYLGNHVQRFEGFTASIERGGIHVIGFQDGETHALAVDRDVKSRHLATPAPISSTGCA